MYKMNSIGLILCLIFSASVSGESSDELSEVSERCCREGETTAISEQKCAGVQPPDDLEPNQIESCLSAMTSCCQQQLRQNDECTQGMKFAPVKQCLVPKTEIGKMCCDECSFGRLAGESQGKLGCGEPPSDFYSPTSGMRKKAYYQCCMEAAEELEATTEAKKETTTTQKPKEKCSKKSCAHICSDEDGHIRCQCREGFRLQNDKKSCKDINECAEAVDDLCTVEGTVCHNTEGAFKCVPLKKRDVSLSCPPGFKKNLVNQVCDDINECQLPKPPCPKYLCENTIGGFKCAGKPGKPFLEEDPGSPTDPTPSAPNPKNDICPSGFRAGPDDECIDIDECEEHLDDCQRLSQYCINTHSAYFCQDHVSKRCAPGFKVNSATGICEDINECEESSEVCKRTEVCINLPGAYNCKSKISTLPKLARKTCQEGTRVRPGGTICEDIDECREGSHLCDQFQNCINTYGAHECRCKQGFELDSSTGSCVDIDECALKLDNCAAGLNCLNVLGSFTCTRRAVTTSTTAVPPMYEYDYEYSDEETNSELPATSKPVTIINSTQSTTTTSTTTTRPTTTSTSTTTTTTPKPTTTSTTTSTTTPSTTSTSTSTTQRPYTPPRRYPYRPNNYPSRPNNRYPNRPNYRPRPTTTTESPTPEKPENDPYNNIPVIPTEVTVTTPKHTTTIERERNPDGSYDIDTSDIPKNRWTNVIGKDAPDENFDANRLFCLNGYERNERGQCVDIDECKANRHICNTMELCNNLQGSYECVCMAGFTRDPSGWCVVANAPTPRTTRKPTSTARTTTTSTPATTTSTTPSTTTSTTTQRHTPRGWYPTYPYGNVPTPTTCDIGYAYSYSQGRCVDVDECAQNRATCAAHEDCVNTEGGYRCVCGWRCRELSPPSHGSRDGVVVRPESTVITVGAQYGQNGPRRIPPTYKQVYGSPDLYTTCPWGYQLTPGKICEDIDECERRSSECGPQQTCSNFYGGYSCQCPRGHRIRDNSCEDVDECSYGNTCSYNGRCINTVGSFRCECSAGFKNAPSSAQVCVDIDECSDSPGLCQHGCVNSWGGYRCYCNRGYRLGSDNSTCVDIDECAEFVGTSGARLCGGQCQNTPGSYRCACPSGYRLADDRRSCIDIDECERDEGLCGDPTQGNVCQNTRGGYHCHHIDCPPGYRLEGKHKCNRVQRACSVSDWDCLQRPSVYSYNFITFVANIFLPRGSVDLFTMHGPAWRDSVVSFDMRLISVKAAPGVKPADIGCFSMRPMANICVISLQCSLGGPQVAELELTMSLHQRAHFAGSAVARLIVIVSEFEF